MREAGDRWRGLARPQGRQHTRWSGRREASRQASEALAWGRRMICGHLPPPAPPAGSAAPCTQAAPLPQQNGQVWHHLPRFLLPLHFSAGKGVNHSPAQRSWGRRAHLRGQLLCFLRGGRGGVGHRRGSGCIPAPSSLWVLFSTHHRPLRAPCRDHALLFHLGGHTSGEVQSLDHQYVCSVFVYTALSVSFTV